jgi:hypothetical protein
MLALDLHGGASLALEPGQPVRGGERLREGELDGDALTELEVTGRHDDGDAPVAEDAFDTVLARDDVSLANR